MSHVRIVCVAVCATICLCAFQGVASQAPYPTPLDAAVTGTAFTLSFVPVVGPVARVIGPAYLGTKVAATAMANYMMEELDSIDFAHTGALGLLNYRSPARRTADTLGSIFNPLNLPRSPRYKSFGDWVSHVWFELTYRPRGVNCGW